MDEAVLRDFSDHVAALARANGVELTQELMDHVMAQSMNRGFTPSATAEVFGELVSEPDEWEPALTSDDDEWEDDDPDTREDPVRDVVSEFAEANFERAVESFDRPLSSREREALWRATAESADSGHLDPEAIARASGVKSWSEMSPGEVNAAMAERARDLAGEDDGPVIEVDEDGRPTSDRGWNQFMTARAQGVEFEDAEEDEWQ